MLVKVNLMLLDVGERELDLGMSVKGNLMLGMLVKGNLMLGMLVKGNWMLVKVNLMLLDVGERELVVGDVCLRQPLLHRLPTVTVM